MVLFTTTDLDFQGSTLVKVAKCSHGLTLFLYNFNIQQMSLYRLTHCFQVKNETLKTEISVKLITKP